MRLGVHKELHRYAEEDHRHYNRIKEIHVGLLDMYRRFDGETFEKAVERMIDYYGEVANKEKAKMDSHAVHLT